MKKKINFNKGLTISMIKPSLRRLNPKNPCKQDEFMKFNHFSPINEGKHGNFVGSQSRSAVYDVEVIQEGAIVSKGLPGKFSDS